MSSANLSRAETAARSRAFAVRSYRVELDLTAAPNPSVTGFTTTTTVEFDRTAESSNTPRSRHTEPRSPAEPPNAARGTTWLDFIGESVEAVLVNGRRIPVHYDGARILLDGLTEQNTVTVVATAAYSHSGEGMHRFVDPVDGETYLYTQYEPADARRVFACFEQPDLKAPFVFTVHAPEGWTVLSNRDAIATETADGVQRVTFGPTLPISTYITAVIAGPYHRVEGGWRGDGLDVALGVYCRASLAEHLDADEILEVTQQGLDFYAEHFGYPYPWGKYDQVFVPEYNLGAMENPGCVTFTERYVFRGAATRAQHEGRATTILHEMAHMWFGDLVTMRWWDDLWLKESFADFMGTLATAEATVFTDAWVAFANRRKAWAYQQDQLPTTHPIVADIVDLEAAKLNFDGITYAKGAAVLKQLVAYVGMDAFFEGSRRYFRAHAFGNTALTDLLRALEQTSGRDLGAWSKAWLETTGMTTLELERGEPGLRLVPSDDRPHRLAVGWYDADPSGAIVRVRRDDLDLAGEPVELTGSADLVLVNDDDLTFAKVRLDDESLQTVRSSLSRVADPLARGLLWSALWNATRDGVLPGGVYLEIVGAHAAAESDVALLTAVLGNALFTVQHYVPDDERLARASAWLETAWSNLLAAAPGSDGQLAWARATADAAAYDGEHADDIRGMLLGATAAPEGLPLDPDLRWSFWTAVSATGNATEAELRGEGERDDTASGRTALIGALAARPDRDVKDAAWRSALDDLTLSNDHLDATIAGFRAGAARDLTVAHDPEYFASLTDVWTTRSIELAERIVVGLFPKSESTDAVDAWIADNADAPAALRRLVLERRDDLARDLLVRAANAATS
ncbi:aminopeptidase N [Planctomonas sp. JC2975]|uniref:aminopeptidase N n=1 Tax=Planctomonas sp. JC2975 TaxID=2729626 RepID=UPI001474EC44|nr:aminopeptidase N [Planctomonas sp. JC2975]NNC13132.1 aminopeptidase N [Planctomonas sp. JC2975]